MVKNENYILSSDNSTKLHYVVWTPDNKPIAVLQLIHGMCEHIERYDEFASFLAQNNIAVIGHDILGHGKSVKSKNDFGFFSNKNGNKYNINDIEEIHQLSKKLFPNSSYFMLGHSMGSFLLRQYLHTYPNNHLNGAIIVGTGHPSTQEIRLARLLSLTLCKTRGKRYKSRLLFNLILGSNNKTFIPEHDINSWLTSDKSKREAYANDLLCGFAFTSGAYRDMFRGIYTLYFSSNLLKMDKSLPILITSGSLDPVGNYGISVEKVYDSFNALAFNDVTLKIWSGLRHEILNELKRDKVYDYIYNWLTKRIKKGQN